jgi:hypothetical protein
MVSSLGILFSNPLTLRALRLLEAFEKAYMISTLDFLICYLLTLRAPRQALRVFTALRSALRAPRLLEVR